MARALRQLDLYATAIPMRSFEHAAARRDVARALVARAEFDDGGEGWGECLPRQYVTSESIDGAADDIEHILFPACREVDFSTPASLDLLPRSGPGGRCINSALCALTLALTWGHPGPPGLGRIGSRVSGVLGSADPARTAKRLRLMRFYGLRDFKLKLGLGDDADRENLRLVYARLAKGIASGKFTLRVDVNGGWDVAATPERVRELKQYGVCVVEQPVFCNAAALADLAAKCELPLMADESLLTPEDAQTLAGRRNVWWNIRLSKNGGMLPASAMARLAAEQGIFFTIGCMVGESGILSAAQRRLLQICPSPRFVEGNYGRFLLADDLATRSIRFGYAGRLSTLRGEGLGVTIDRRKLLRYGRLIKSLRT